MKNLTEKELLIIEMMLIEKSSALRYQNDISGYNEIMAIYNKIITREV